MNNYNVLTGENGNHGYELARKHHPDIILCDMMMPGTDGQQFLKLAKADNSICDIPIIFFSAGATPTEVQRQLGDGMGHYLKKPFTEEDLLFAIHEAGIN